VEGLVKFDAVVKAGAGAVVDLSACKSLMQIRKEILATSFV
jgi:thiamine biosynthesis protein ThiC